MKAYGDSDAIFHALADGTRRTVLESLRTGPRSVADIAAHLPVSRPAVSQHLKVLREAGLVTVTPAGNRRIYGVDPDGLMHLHAYVNRYWDDVLSAFRDEIDRKESAG